MMDSSWFSFQSRSFFSFLSVLLQSFFRSGCPGSGAMLFL
uniref:Uncharacterized protein n=1 Tax=Arundo donax TaxID=35708 RepID=A0A0A9HBY0_ARUDO